ncbi:MAG: carbon-nitrogen hydrolase family protein [Helicobacteraceae bacterium]|nr:carbon-nitrogen hydrolase family protein [Helicobacteraceae bacterium]
MRRCKIATLDIAIFQTADIAASSAKLDYLLSQAKAKRCEIAVLGEYVLSPFFKELESTPIKEIREIHIAQQENLKKLAQIYNIYIVAPLITVQKNKIYKSIFLFTPNRSLCYDQRIFMDYPHWNEARFFAAPRASSTPFFFTLKGFKIGVIAGFELHFDALWQSMIDRGIDAAIAVTANTFESFARWQTLVKSRSFTAGSYLLRANRVGECSADDQSWLFYGNSLICNPMGEIENALDEREGIVLAEIDKKAIKEAKESFRFNKIWRRQTQEKMS